MDDSHSSLHTTDHAVRILATLNEEGPCHVMELAAGLDEHPIPIDRTCAHLQQAGQLRRQHGGTYAITETGYTVLENST